MEEKNNGGCLFVLFLVIFALIVCVLVTRSDKISDEGNNNNYGELTATTDANTFDEEDDVQEPDENTTSKRKFVSTTNELNLRKPDGSRDIITLLPKGEVLEVLGEDPYNPNRILVLWKNIKGSLWNKSIEELNVPDFSGTGYEGVDKERNLNFRQRGTNSEKIGTIPKNTPFWVLGTYTGDTSRVVVIWNGQCGTVAKKTITKLGDSGLADSKENNENKDKVPETTEPQESKPNKEDKVPETTKPQESKPNQEDKVPETTEPQESKPNKEDKVPETTEPTEPSDTSNPTTSRKFVVTTEGLNLRAPDGSEKLIQLLQPGEVLEVLEKDPYNSNRVLVLWHGIKGSILNASQKELKNVPEFYGTGYNGVCYSEDLNFRVAGEDSETIQVINKNHYFQVLGRYVGDDSRVVAIFRGRIGTLWRKPITQLRKNAVFVDEKTQMCTLIKKGEFIANTPCVTGTFGKSETPKGRFNIYSKQEDRYLQGKDLEGKPYKSWVEYWMPFKGGCGLHDASWRSEFGGTIYKQKGSLGCVNLPHWFAEKVFNTVNTGDEVCVAN